MLRLVNLWTSTVPKQAHQLVNPVCGRGWSWVPTYCLAAQTDLWLQLQGIQHPLLASRGTAVMCLCWYRSLNTIDTRKDLWINLLRKCSVTQSWIQIKECCLQYNWKVRGVLTRGFRDCKKEHFVPQRKFRVTGRVNACSRRLTSS